MKKLLIILLLLYNVCNAQKYDTIRVGHSTIVNVIFESRIVKPPFMGLAPYEAANGKIEMDIFAEIDSVDGNRLTLMAAGNNFETTNLFVETEEGYFNFILVYDKWPKNQLIQVNNDKASIVKKPKFSMAEMKKLEMEKGKRLQLDTLSKMAKIALEKPYIEPTIGERKQAMMYYLNGIYVEGPYLFFRVTIKNKGTIKYDLGYQQFAINDSNTKGVKSTLVETPEPLIPLYILNDETKVVNSKEELSKVFVFKKFTIDTHKSFTIELWEKDGQRKTELKIPSSELLNAKPL
jgi:hypothetical protein